MTQVILGKESLLCAKEGPPCPSCGHSQFSWLGPSSVSWTVFPACWQQTLSISGWRAALRPAPWSNEPCFTPSPPLLQAPPRASDLGCLGALTPSFCPLSKQAAPKCGPQPCSPRRRLLPYLWDTSSCSPNSPKQNSSPFISNNSKRKPTRGWPQNPPPPPPQAPSESRNIRWASVQVPTRQKSWHVSQNTRTPFISSVNPSVRLQNTSQILPPADPPLPSSKPAPPGPRPHVFFPSMVCLCPHGLPPRQGSKRTVGCDSSVQALRPSHHRTQSEASSSSKPTLPAPLASPASSPPSQIHSPP